MQVTADNHWGAIPEPGFQFLEHPLRGGEEVSPAATTWLEQGQVMFAALEFIDGKPWLIRGQLVRSKLTGLLRLTRLAVESWHGDALPGRCAREHQRAALPGREGRGDPRLVRRA